jgi:methionine sulfoxide reductase heme-binding subunit
MLPQHFFWITSRAAGTAALLLSSLAVSAGLLIGGKLVKGRPGLRHLHEALSLASLAALVVHAVRVLGLRAPPRREAAP